MNKFFLSLFLILSTLSFSQQPFRYDTIRVSKDDTRNIHQGLQQQQRQQQPNQQRSTYSQSEAKTGFDTRNLRYGLNLSLNLNNDYSLFRFAPQVGYQKRLIQNKLPTRRVAIIDRKDYGTMNGNAVFKQILEILELES